MLQYIICVACVIYSIYFKSVIVKDEFIVVLRDFAGLSRPTFVWCPISAKNPTSVLCTTFHLQHNFSFATQLLVCNTTSRLQHNFVCNTTLCLQHNCFLQHNFFFATQLFFYNRNPVLCSNRGSYRLRQL